MKMWKGILFRPLVFVMCVTLVPVAAIAGSCVVPDVPQAFDKAGAVFIGKITKVESERLSNGVRGATYLVEFEVEESWKGVSAGRVTVSWRPKAFACPYFAVGDVGERYLVYADILDSRVTALEITVVNRTALAPSSSKPVNLFASAPREPTIPLFRGTSVELNRMDASKDVEILRLMKACECLLPNVLHACLDPTWRLQQVTGDTDAPSADSPCCACWRRNMKRPK